MRITAPISGEPKMKEIAAKLPAAATTARTWSGASRRSRRTARMPSPEPSAMSGASGPSTTPRPMVASAASTTPGSSTGCVTPVFSPSEGLWPPMPGRRTIASAVTTPARARTGSGHQAGAPSS